MNTITALKILRKAAAAVPPPSTTGTSSQGLPGFLAKGPMSLQVTPGATPGGTDQQAAQMEAEKAQMDTQMKAQEEKQKLEAENAKLKLEAQANQQAVKAQQDALKAQQMVAKAEAAKTKAEQALQSEKAKSQSQAEQLKTIQQKAQVAESQAKAQANFAVQQAKLQGQQAKAEQQAAKTREQLSQQHAQISQEAMQKEQELSQRETQQQAQLAQHDAQQKAQQAQQQAQQEIAGAKQEASQQAQQAQLGAQQESLGMQEKSLIDKLKGSTSQTPGMPVEDPIGMAEPHPSVTKLAMYIRRHSGGSASDFFKHATQQPPTFSTDDFLKSPFKGKSNGLQDWASDLRKTHGPNVQFTGQNSDILKKHYTQAGRPKPQPEQGVWQSLSRGLGYQNAEDMGKDYDKWLTQGVGNIWEKNYWDKARRAKTWYGKIGGGVRDLGEGIGSLYLRDPMRGFTAASDKWQKGDYLGGAGSFAGGTLHGLLNFGGLGLVGKGLKTIKPVTRLGKLGKGALAVGGTVGVPMAVGGVADGLVGKSDADTRLEEEALRETDRINQALTEKEKLLAAQAQEKWDKDKALPTWNGEGDIQSFNRMGVDRNPVYSGMPEGYTPNPILEWLMNLFVNWTTGGVGGNPTLAQRPIGDDTFNPTDELASYIQRARVNPNPFAQQ